MHRTENFIDLGSKVGQKDKSGLLLSSSQSISVSLLQDSEQSVLQLCRPLFMGGVFGASVKHVQGLTFMQLCEWFPDCVIVFFLNSIFFLTSKYPLGSLEVPH